MKIKKKHSIIGIVSLIVIIFTISILLFNNVKENQLPVPNIKEYNNNLNAIRTERANYKEKAQTSEGKKTLKKHWDKIISKQSLQIRPVEFFGKVEDQNGSPVEGALISFVGGSGYLARGSGEGTVKTNVDGLFSIDGANGVDLSIDNIAKAGYDYRTSTAGYVKIVPVIFDSHQRFHDSLLWSDFTKNNPYIFKVCKVEKYARVDVGGNKYYFYSDGREDSINLTSRKKNKYVDKKRGDLNVSFTRTNNHWQLTLSSSKGGLLESNDLYMNIAPESGYQKSIVIEGDRVDGESVRLNKNYFLKINESKYARLAMNIRPYYKDKSFIQIFYAINLEGGRQFAIKPSPY